jgi:hypothetical protein
VRALIRQVEADPIGVFGEIGSWDDMTADERKVFRAIGHAHVATNVPIFTHTGIPGNAALEQLDILEDAGVKPNRIKFDHSNDTTDVEYLLSLAIALDGHPRIHALAGDTDGVDGQEEIAGACIAPDTLARAWGCGLRPKEMLADNDAHSLFMRLGDSVITGPTLTNVNDFRAIFIAGHLIAGDAS